MAASAASVIDCERWPVSGAQVRLLRFVLVFGVALSLAVAVVLTCRRMAGAFHQPLSPRALIIVGIVMAATLVTGRLCWRMLARVDGKFSHHRERLFYLAPTLVVLAVGLSVSLPETPVGALSAFWGLVGGMELGGWWMALRPVSGRRVSPAPGSAAGQERPPSSDLGAKPMVSPSRLTAPVVDVASDDEEQMLLPPGVSQRITRAAEPEDTEVIHGLLQCLFAAGQRQQNIHLAFCPPMESIPEMTVEQLDGPDVRIRPTIVQTYGACLEVKLISASSEPAGVQLQFFACERPSR
jgi:hypothetical protein